jgi:elongation factor P
MQRAALALPRRLLVSSSLPRALLQRSASTSASDVREGALLELDGEPGLWRVMARQFTRMAQGRAFVQMELRHLTNPVKRDMRFRSDEMLSTAALDSPVRYTVLYASSDSVALMHTVSFEQVELPLAAFGAGARYLHDGCVVTIEHYQGEPALVQLPSRIAAQVLELDAGGGDAATVLPVAAGGGSGGGGGGGGKPAAGFKVRVPKFIKVGDVVLIDTSDGKYLSREGGA